MEVHHLCIDYHTSWTKALALKLDRFSLRAEICDLVLLLNTKMVQLKLIFRKNNLPFTISLCLTL